MSIARMTGAFGLAVLAAGCVPSGMSQTDARLIGGGIGGIIGNELSDGDSRITAASAAIGAGIASSAQNRAGSCIQRANYDAFGNLVGRPAGCSRQTGFPDNIPLPGQ